MQLPRTARFDRTPPPAGPVRVNGFTLVELVVVVLIIGTLAAVAAPRFLSLGQDARIASIKTLAATLRATAENVRVMCKTNPECDYDNQLQHLMIGGKMADLNYGWLDSGDDLGRWEIDAWVTYAGFSASLPAGDNTLFTLDGAPDPANCSVDYHDAYLRPSHAIDIVLATAGC